MVEPNSPIVKTEGFSLAQDFPLPGNVTSVYQYNLAKASGTRKDLWAKQTDVLTAPLPQNKQVDALRQFCSNHAERGEGLEKAVQSGSAISIQCTAEKCPELMRKDFVDLFPHLNFKNLEVTVISLTQKSKHDMSVWSPDMEVERDLLTMDFINIASQICGTLKKAGYWADFIDPASGRPYLGPFTNSTLFETDERLRGLGYRIEDLGCCKVISHDYWGRHAFVGTIFTVASAHAEEVTHILDTVKRLAPDGK
jgi:hypothetical protein